MAAEGHRTQPFPDPPVGFTPVVGGMATESERKGKKKYMHACLALSTIYERDIRVK